MNDGVVQVTRSVYAGKLLGTVVCKERQPQMILVRPRAFPAPAHAPDATGNSPVVQVEPVLAEDQVATQVTDIIVEAGKASVTGGGGMGGPDI